ncbi:hypothetical protein E6Q11_04410 [Candidatus Dojkabacteria bacterium]|uniref:LysM domain-containing protein n=1 Tax=Candidatus Dojkabacteria bacterium TaxID=2099670 RepID=A0A5C7J563_9BACT|nr:MAG: hypothetical protein E6Q11_04410 [Candidatus Dojkabacteria bacterium]
MRDYRVKEGDTLASIAEKEYGSSELWVNIWNDNDFIENPNIIEKDWVITLRTKKPFLKEPLKESLGKKAEINKKENIPSITPIPAQAQSISTTPSVTPTSAAPAQSPKTLNDAQIAFLGQCESGMTANRNSGNGYYGAFQFSPGTWNRMNTGYARADLAPIEVQIDAVQRLLQTSSIFGQFPGCARKMQAMGIL